MSDVLSVLSEMQRGQVLCDINEKFNCLMKSVMETGGKGELTVKLMVKPSKFALGGGVLQVDLEHECKVKKPELSVGASTFFTLDTEGNIGRNPPGQDMLYEEEEQKQNG